MRRLIAVACLVSLAACSTAPSATTASGPDDTQAPPTTVVSATTSTGGLTATTPVTTEAPPTTAVSSSSSSTTTTTTTTPTTTGSTTGSTATTGSTVSSTSSTTSTTVAGTTTTQAEPEITEVEIENFRFVPAEVTVGLGDTIRWSVTSGTHTTTADGAVWSSPAMASGESFAWTPDTPGTFGYFCAIHPGMRGTITVEG